MVANSIRTCTAFLHHDFLARNWSLCVRFVAADFLILWNSNKTTALLVVLGGARNEGRLLFYPLLVSEDLKQR